MTQSPPPKPPFEERLTDAVFKLIVAGSGGYALYNLYVEDIPKAAIAGLVSLGSGLMTSFGQGLMTALGDRMKQRGEASGQAINEAVDRAIDITLPKLTGFHKQYLEALKTHCYNLNVEGFKGYLPRLALEDVYVPLRVHPGAKRRATGSSKTVDIWDLLPKKHHSEQMFPNRLMAIVADPGYGKTTLTRFLTLSFSNQAYLTHGARELIPVLLLFRDIYPRIQSRTQPSLPQLIVEQVQQLPRCAELRTSEPWFEEQLMQGKCLVMLDGLDEVRASQRDLVCQWTNWQMQNYPTQFILTSRPHGYEAYSSLFEGIQRIDILDFNNDQKQTFINQWYRFITWELTWKRHWEESLHNPDAEKRLSREQAEAESNAEAQQAADDLSRQLFADQSLTDLARNPLLITIIAATHEANESLPTERVRLYRKIFNLLLEDRPNRRFTRLTISSTEDNQYVLQYLAWRLTQAGITQFSPQQGAAWIQSRLADLEEGFGLTPKQFLREIQQVSGLLAGGESELYEFTHKTFQEYLTAVELTASSWGRRKAIEKFANPAWEEVVYFFAMLTDPMPFIERALEDPGDSYTLRLAHRLANDSPKIDEDIKQQLLDVLWEQVPESSPELRLEQRFLNLTPLSATTAISEPITWGEYQLFLHDQAEKQFHSWAGDRPILPEHQNQPIADLSWEDARWFCAWLATQLTLIPDGGVYEYRLPTPEELAAARATNPSSLQVWTADPILSGGGLQVVRQRIPDRYSNLVSYLANGRWREANQETDSLMLEMVGNKASNQSILEMESIYTFPCDDLRIIYQLWVKFSGGKFGFSVQKKIWLEVGGKLDFGADIEATKVTYQKMSDRTQWNVNTSLIPHNPSMCDLNAPDGHLPLFVAFGLGDRAAKVFSRMENCGL